MKKGAERLLCLIAVTAFLCAVLSALPVALAASTPHPDPQPPYAVFERPGCSAIASFTAGGGICGQTETTEKSWEFERFDSEITVHEDGSFTVRETQVVNFTGSFTFLKRDITTQTAAFDEGRTYGKVRVKDVEVYNLDGTPYDGSRWEGESYTGGELITINFQARDEQLGWIISYRMKGAMVYAEDYDRLYWNALSIDRAVPIKHSRLTVELPEGTDMDGVESLDYYKSPTGSTHDSGRDGNVLWWEAENVYPYTSFTIDVSLPKGAIMKPWPYRASTMWLMLGLAAAILLGAVLAMLALWLWKGRDVHGGPVPSVAYEPPREQRPAVLAMLVNQLLKTDDVGATVVDLAVRGKLCIIEDPEEKTPGRKSFVFERRDASNQDLLSYESALMKGLFAKGERVEEDDLEMWDKMTPIMNAVRKEVKKARLFRNDPEKTVSRYFRWGTALILLPPIALFFLRFSFDLGYVWLLLVGTVPAGIAVAAIGHAMPQRTALGSRLFWQTMAFREYLKTAEAGEPESMTLQSFQDNLPYAMVLGMADKWASLFAGILTTAPDWYQGAGPGFSTTSLTSSLRNMGNTIYTSGMPVSSGSSGSGFSSSGGGGFGGGSSGGGFGGGGSSAG